MGNSIGTQPWDESDRRICVYNNARFHGIRADWWTRECQTHWSHTPGEPVPYQIAPYVSPELWNELLTEIHAADYVMNLSQRFGWCCGPLSCAVAIALGIINRSFGFFIIFVFGFTPTMIGFSCYASHELKENLSLVEYKFQPKFAPLFLKAHSISRPARQWIEVMVPKDYDQLEGAKPPLDTVTLNVTMPFGVLPGQRIVVQGPGGRQVTIDAPQHVVTGQVIKVAVPIDRKDEVVEEELDLDGEILPPENTQGSAEEKRRDPSQDFGPVSRSHPPGGVGRHKVKAQDKSLVGKLLTNKKQNVDLQLLHGVPVDTTGDGFADGTGYDTTGDGRIDKVKLANGAIQPVMSPGQGPGGNRSSSGWS